ncbi:MAG: helix-turn-helix domain-containing protein [Terrimicrobiaceae bacterium]
MSEQNSTRLATRIKEARNRLTFSQSQAAAAWGISKRTLQEWEQGRRIPRGLALAALEGILLQAKSKRYRGRA